MNEIIKIKSVIEEEMAKLQNLGWAYGCPILTSEGQGVIQGLEWVLSKIEEIIEQENKELLDERN